MAATEPISHDRRFQDLTGRTFGHWSVLSFGERRKYLKYWLCQCTCGTEQLVCGTNLTSGKTKRCEQCRLADCGVKPGFASAHQQEYRCYQGMIARCENKNSTSYPRYGGRGIKVCERWRRSFEAFFRDMGSRPTIAHSLDRFPDYNGNYEPGNVRWATDAEQARNKSNNRIVACDGVSMCITDWGDKVGIAATRIADRLSRGWNTRDAIYTPARKIAANNEVIAIGNHVGTVEQVAAAIGITYSALHKRIKRGWPHDKIINTPMRRR